MLSVADTAFSIAAVRAEERKRPADERLFDDPFAEIFCAAGVHASEGTQRFLALPFFRDGVRLRTRFIDDFVREGLAAGLDQLVLLGAGFDARALRMPEVSERGTVVYEVDIHDQLERKRAILEDARVALPDTVKYVPFDFAAGDLEGPLGRELHTHGFRLGQGALFVWEGVIGYIDGPAIDRSLRFMAKAGGPGSRLVFTFGEDTFYPDTAVTRLRRLGYSRCDDFGMDEVWRRYLPGQAPPHARISRIGGGFV